MLQYLRQAIAIIVVRKLLKKGRHILDSTKQNKIKYSKTFFAAKKRERDFSSVVKLFYDALMKSRHERPANKIE